MGNIALVSEEYRLTIVELKVTDEINNVLKLYIDKDDILAQEVVEEGNEAINNVTTPHKAKIDLSDGVDLLKIMSKVDRDVKNFLI